MTRSNDLLALIDAEILRCKDAMEKVLVEKGVVLTAGSASKSIHLYLLCNKMKEEGFEYASFIPTGMDVLKGFIAPPGDFGSDWTGKPTHSIYFSKLVSLDGSSTDTVPAWFNWLHNTEDGDTSKIILYKNSNILFAKYDKSRICEVGDIPLKIKTEGLNPMYVQIFGEDPSILPMISNPDYASKKNDFDGVHATVTTMSDFSKWGVETIAVWCIAGLNQMKYFRSSGDWSYEKSLLLEEWGSSVALGL